MARCLRDTGDERQLKALRVHIPGECINSGLDYWTGLLDCYCARVGVYLCACTATGMSAPPTYTR